jgi:hypothetical protein
VKTQGREHRRGVGRRDHRAEQERVQPRQVEQLIRRHPGERSRDDDPHRAQERGRRRDLAQAPPRRRQAALEQDRGERHHPHLPRELRVVELHAAEPVGAEHHAQGEERD